MTTLTQMLLLQLTNFENEVLNTTLYRPIKAIRASKRHFLLTGTVLNTSDKEITECDSTNRKRSFIAITEVFSVSYLLTFGQKL